MVNLENQFGHEQEIKVVVVSVIAEYLDIFLLLGNQWLKGQYAIFPSGSTSFQIVFEGIVGL
jgi:hypothetical protein